MKLCWYCNCLLDITDDFYGDIICKKCGMLNSIMNQADIQPYVPDGTEGEEEMGLKDWSKENAKYIKIKSGESYEGVYQGYKEGVNMNGDPAIIYNFDGKEFKSSSTKLSDIFADIAEGTKVRISRQGEGLQTKWMVEKI